MKVSTPYLCSAASSKGLKLCAMVGEGICDFMKKANVCNICGDAGFLDCLAICDRCSAGAEHAYCMAAIPETVPVDWVCGECQQACMKIGNKWLAGDGLQPIQPYKKRLLSREPSDFLHKVCDDTQSEKLLLYEGTLENGAELAASVQTDKVGDGIYEERSCSGRANEVASTSSAQMVTADCGFPSTSKNVISEKLKEIIDQITKDMRTTPIATGPSCTPGSRQVVSTTVEEEGAIRDFGTRLQVEEEVQGSRGALAYPSCVVKNTPGGGRSESCPLNRTAPLHLEVASERMSEGCMPYHSALTNEYTPGVQGSSCSSASMNIATTKTVSKSRPCVVKSQQLTTAPRLSCGQRAADNKAQYNIAKKDGDGTVSSRCLSRKWSKSMASTSRASKVASAMRVLLKSTASASQQCLPKSEENACITSRAEHHYDVEVSSHVVKEPHNICTPSPAIPDAESTQAGMPSTCMPGVDEPANISRSHANAEEISAKDSPTVSHVTVTESPSSKDRSARDKVPPHLLERPGRACVTQKTCRKSTNFEGHGVDEAEHTHSSEGVEATVGSSLHCRGPARHAASLQKVATIPGLNDGVSTTSRVCGSYSSRKAEDEFIDSSGSSLSKSLRPDDSHLSKLAMRRSNMMSRSAVGPGKTTKDRDGIATFKARQEPHEHHLGARDEVMRYGPLDRTSSTSLAVKYDSTEESPSLGHWAYNSGPVNRAVRCYLCNEVGHPHKLCQNVNVDRPLREWRRPPFGHQFGNQQYGSHAKRPFSRPHELSWERPLQRPLLGFRDPIEKRKPWRPTPMGGKEVRFMTSRPREGSDDVFPNTLEPRPEFQTRGWGKETFVSNMRSGPSKPAEYLRGHERQAVRWQDKVAKFRALRALGVPSPPPPRSGEVFPCHGHVTSQDGRPDNRLRAGFPPAPLSHQAFREDGHVSMLPVLTDLPSQSRCLNDNANSVQERPAAPDLQVLWTGCFNISSKTNRPTCYTELQATASTKASPKVFEALLAMPPELELEEMRRGMENDTWPRSFKESLPTSDSIGMYFFPKNFKHDDAWYKSLIQRLFTDDLVLRAAMEFAHLLIFPSQLLPEGQQRWFGRFFLWGIFRRKVTEPGHEAFGQPLLRDLGHELASSRGNGEVIDMDIDPDDAPPQTRGPFFPLGFSITPP